MAPADRWKQHPELRTENADAMRQVTHPYQTRVRWPRSSPVTCLARACLRCATRIRFSQVAFVLVVEAKGLEPSNLLTASQN